jgi:peroxiredoxin
MNRTPRRISLGMRKMLFALFAAAACAAPAPDFRLTSSSGAPVRLSDYRGKIVLLDFWATECGGCKLEIPWFIELAREYRDRGLAVVGVSMDILYEDLRGAAEGWQRVRPFIAQHGVNYPVLMGDDAVGKAYRVDALPLTLLIDRTGKIVYTHPAPPKNGKEEFRREIEMMLK